VPAATGRDIPIKRVAWHAMIYHIMHQQAPWQNADSGSYQSTYLSLAGLGLVSPWMGVFLGIYFNVFILVHAFGFDSQRSAWNAPIFLSLHHSISRKLKTLSQIDRNEGSAGSPTLISKGVGCTYWEIPKPFATEAIMWTRYHQGTRSRRDPL
jgi:hypothetical protein